MPDSGEYAPIELLAKVLEYEHALEHVAEVSEHHKPGVCAGCQILARSALDGVNRGDFREKAADHLGRSQSPNTPGD